MFLILRRANQIDAGAPLLIRLRIGSTDPADRFLAASALVYDLTLVTADARLREIDGIDVLPNT